MKNVLVTGAAGFIGANFAEYFVNKHPDYNVIVVDKLTYAGNLANLDKVKDKITFIQADICDFEKMQEIFKKYEIIDSDNASGERVGGFGSTSK